MATSYHAGMNGGEDQDPHGAWLQKVACRTARLGGWTIDLPERRLTWCDENCAIHDVPPGYQPTLEEGINLFPEEHRAEVRRKVEACARDLSRGRETHHLIGILQAQPALDVHAVGLDGFHAEIEDLRHLAGAFSAAKKLEDFEFPVRK